MSRSIPTSFSDYDSLDNNSISPNQFEHLNKHYESTEKPSPFIHSQWNFMMKESTEQKAVSSIREDILLGKSTNLVFEKENNSMFSNLNNQNTTEIKSKSYINAMIALQKKVKSLENEKMFIQKSLNDANRERSHSISESNVLEKELNSKLRIMEMKTEKLEEIIEENKVLRQSKEEKNRKIKALEKKFKELSIQFSKASENFEIAQSENERLNKELVGNTAKIESLEKELKKLYEKNELLEEVKEKSTVSLLEKYNKSIEFTESLLKENGKLKNETQFLKAKHCEEIKNLIKSHQDEIMNCRVEFEKLKESLSLKESLIVEEKKQRQYFKEAFERKDQEYSELIRSHKKIKDTSAITEIISIYNNSPETLEKHETKPTNHNLSKKETPQEKPTKKVIVESNEKNEVISVPCLLIPSNKNSFAGFDSEDEELEENQIPYLIETKSVGKKMKMKKDKKCSISSESRVKSKEHRQENKIKKVINLVSPTKSKKVSKKVNESNETAKSCQNPQTSFINKESLEEIGSFEGGLREEKARYFYSAECPPLPRESRMLSNIIQEKDIDSFQSQNYVSVYSVEEAVLIELQRELLELYEEQESLIMASNDEFATQEERSEFVGRLKQLNEHLKLKNQKICELKSKF